MARIVEPVFIEDECVGERADLEQPVPIRRIACQSRNLQSEHNAGSPQTHLRHQLLKSFAVHSCCGGLTEIIVDHDNLLHRPTQSYGTLAKIILSYRTLCVLEHLTQSGLPYVQICVAL